MRSLPCPSGARGGVGLFLGRGEASGGLGLGGLALGVEQAVAHLADDDEAEQQHDDDRHQQGARDDAELQIAPPQPDGGKQRTAYPPHQQPRYGPAGRPVLEQPAALQETAHT
ncbi:hypothetical protein SPW_1382 [Streptomyces sp. W007]|nr:hypothetical protein SPW_1382 [Streptomyces sp. W007]